MKTLWITLTATLTSGAALAAPPSSILTGPEGTLSWTITAADGGVRVEGRSPKWTVHHEAAPDLTPRRTVRSDAAGREVTVEYGPGRVTVAMPGKTVVHERDDLWDADSLDVRLGDRVARGLTTDLGFDALDPSNGKIYAFQATTIGDEPCGAAPCRHVRVRLGGMLKLVGPKWEYWFAPSGQLMRFEGPIGSYACEVAR